MKKLTALFLIVFTFLFLSHTAFAAETPNRRPTGLPSQEIVRTTPGLLQACQAREAAIKNRLSSLQRLVTNMEDVFNNIATRVENFYTNTVVPSGKTVSNYTTLVNDIATKKTAADSAIAKTQMDVNNFSCATTPRTIFNQFREDMQLTKSALKDYRTAVKNLIVAVHTVTPETKPSISPTSK